jgi:hypothetical protein
MTREISQLLLSVADDLAFELEPPRDTALVEAAQSALVTPKDAWSRDPARGSSERLRTLFSTWEGAAV